MNIENYPYPLQGAEKQTSLAEIVKKSDEACQNCHPLTPIICMNGCKVWSLKNEFRKLSEMMKDQSFMTKLLNTLKNKRRLQILGIISKGRYSIYGLQKELKKQGYYHSQQTIAEEYVTPLTEVGLTEEDQNQYYATVFGYSLNELIKNSREIWDALPPHSECYEEITLSMLSDKPKTYEDLKSAVPARSVGRVLNRLRKAGLLVARKENDYIFFFRSKRDSNREKFSPTERRVYENIPTDGISAQKLAEKTKISLRRTYKYLRRLKGKKVAFTRERPKSYALTEKGVEAAFMLESIRNLAVEALATAAQPITYGEAPRLLTRNSPYTRQVKKVNEIIQLTTLKVPSKTELHS